MSDTPERPGGRVIHFPAHEARPVASPDAPARPSPEGATTRAVTTESVGLRELREVVASFVGLLDSFELYVQQVRALASLSLSGQPVDHASLRVIVENSGRDAARVAEIRANYLRLKGTLDEALAAQRR